MVMNLNLMELNRSENGHRLNRKNSCCKAMCTTVSQRFKSGDVTGYLILYNSHQDKLHSLRTSKTYLIKMVDLVIILHKKDSRSKAYLSTQFLPQTKFLYIYRETTQYFINFVTYREIFQCQEHTLKDSLLNKTYVSPSTFLPLLSSCFPHYLKQEREF